MIARREPERLFHYTCEHSAERIRRVGVLVPGTHLTKHPDAGHLVWLTDIEPPAPREVLGLTMHSQVCDRTAFTFEVTPDYETVQWWGVYRRQHQELLGLEDSPGVMPMHWFVSETPVPVLREVVAVKT